MPRAPRDLAPGIQHVGNGAAGAAVYFQDDLDRLTWLRLFVATIDRFAWRCIAVCLLTTHWHAIIDLPDNSHRYVARNPVGAGLVQRPEDWLWSSYGKTIGVAGSFEFVNAADVLAEFGTTRIAQIRGLRRFVES